MKNKWSACIQLAAVYVGTVVGAGFATGREIVVFFSQYGFYGLIGILISGFIFSYFGSKLMRISVRIKATSYQQFTVYLFGKYIGNIINLALLLMLIGVCAVMFSGAGAVFEEQLGINKTIGVLFTIVLSLLVMMVGTKGLFAVNTFVVPIMISFSLILFLLSINLPGFGEKIFVFQDISLKMLSSPFSYSALNIALSIAVLVPAATEIGDEEVVKWGGIIGGIALMLILLSSHFSLMMLPDVEQFSIPMASIMKTLAPQLSWVYILVIYGEIFTSVIGNIYGLERQLRSYISLPSIVLMGGIILVSYCFSYVQYGTCVCSVGLDMIALTGDVSAETLSAIIADEAAIGMINKKTTAVRVIPVPGMKEGEMVEFGGLLGRAPVMGVNPFSSAKFINRAGRIPSPLQALIN